jgi:hypothetical protein
MKLYAILILTLFVFMTQKAQGQSIAFDPTQPVAGSPIIFSITFGGIYVVRRPPDIQITTNGTNIEITILTNQLFFPIQPQTYPQTFTIEQAGTYTYNVRMLGPLGPEIFQTSGTLVVAGTPGEPVVVPVESGLARAFAILLLLCFGALAILRRTTQ